MAGAAAAAPGRPDPSPGRAMGMALAAQVAAILPVFLMGALGPFVIVDVGLTAFAFGALFAAFYGSAAFASLVLAPRADRAGVWRLVRVALVGTSLVALALATVANGAAPLFALMIGAGLANGTVQPATNVVVARYVPTRRQGFAFGLKQSAIPAATLIGGAAVPLIGATLGWRWSFAAAALLALAVAASTPGDGARRTWAERGSVQLPPRALLLALAATMAIGAACANAMAAFVSVSIVESGHSPSSAGIAILLGSVASITVRIALGLAADRWPLPLLRIASGLILGGVLAHLALGFGSALWVLVLGTVAAFALGWGWSGILLLAVLRLSPGAVGRATGATHSGVFIGAVLGPLCFGLIADLHGFPAAWIALAALGTCGAALAWFVAALVGRDREQRSLSC